MGQVIYDTDIYNFMNLAKMHNVYAYGAGKIKLAWLNKGLYLRDVVDYIVDSNVDKQNKECILEDRKYIVISPEEMKEKITADDIVLITSRSHYIDIFIQIQRMEITAKCFVLSYIEDHFIHDERDDILLEQWKEKCPLIPKVIHYCWFGKAPLSEKIKMNMETWKRNCPDYEIIRWDESNYDIEKNSFMKQAYEMKMWAFVSDYARLDILYNSGGFYFDTDVTILKSLDSLRYHKGFMGIETGNPGKGDHVYIAPGLGMGAIKGHRLLRLFMGLYKKKFISMDGLQMDIVPIGEKITDMLKNKGFVQENRLQMLDETVIYPAEYFNARSVVSKYRSRETDHSYSIHWYEGSWLSEKPELRADIQELKAQQFGIKVQKMEAKIHHIKNN